MKPFDKLKILGTRDYQRGQALTEMAFAVIMMVVLLAGVLDIGRAYYTFLALQDAAAEGAVYGSIRPDDMTGIDARVRGESPNGFIDWSNATVTPTVLGLACRGYGIKVEVETDYTLLTPFIGAIVGGQTLPLKAEVVNTIMTPECP